MGESMTTKEMAEAAGVSTDTVARKIKELYQDKMQARKRTELNQIQAIAVMSAIRKEGFVSVPQNAVALPQNAEDRMNRLESMMEKLLTIVAATIKPQMEELPAPPPMEYRSELRRIVSKAAKESGDYSGTWEQLYTDSYYRLGINIRERAKNRGMEKLDYAEEAGLIPDLLAIAREIFA
jgi:hypothetical protein